MGSPTEFLWVNSRNVTVRVDLGPVRGPLSTVVPMTLVYVAILVTGLFGNLTTCLVVARNKHMQTPTNLYLFSLAISDLLLLVLGLPQEIYQLWVMYPYSLGETMCVLRGLASETSTNASILTITAFTVERYIAICHPLRVLRSAASQPKRVICAVWIVGAVAAAPLASQFGIVYEMFRGERIPYSAACKLRRPIQHAFLTSTTVFFVLPFLLLSILYIRIWKRLLQSNRERASLRSNSSKNSATLSSSRRAVIKVLVAVVVAFFVCWAPFHAQRLMATYVTKPSPADIALYNVLTYISGVTYYVSATINPILYSILSLKFRKAFADTLAGCCGRGTARDRRRSRATLSSASRLPRKIVSTGGSSSFADDEIRKLKSTL